MSRSSEPTIVRRTHAAWMSHLLAALIVGNLAGVPVLGAEPEASRRPETVARPAKADKPEDGEKGDGHSQKAATVGFLLLAVITFTGLTLVALVVVWGHRVRRVVRGSLPTQSARDDLWYLRPPKNRADDAESTDGARADETETL